MKKYTLILLLVAQSLCAQISYVGDAEFDHFDYNIKVMDEFMLRFNLQNVLLTPEQDSMWRFDNRVLLFDKEAYYSNQGLADSLIHAIEEQNVKISFQDSTWCALATCQVLFKEKKDSITLLLKTEQVKSDIYKWSIVDANGKILELTPKTKSDRLRILPTDNDVDFMSLNPITTINYPNIVLYSKNDYTVDRLSVFNALVYNGLLQIQHVKELIYCFESVKGFRFYVKQFTRDERNAGYLIYRIERTTPTNSRTERDVLDSQDDKLNTAESTICTFYRMLSSYANDPYNLSLARSIQSLFINTSTPYVFGIAHLYNDVDDIMHCKSNKTFVSIKEYLFSLADYVSTNHSLKFSVRDIKPTRIGQNVMEMQYQLVIYENNEIIYSVYNKMKLKDGNIVCIEPLLL